MSYGVIGSKSVHLLVESTGRVVGTDADEVLDRFQTGYGAAWVPGRITLTRLHLMFLPTRPGLGLAMAELSLGDVTGVEISAGRVTRVIGIRTARHVVRLRTTGAPLFAQAIAEGAEHLRLPA
jgi:hypothetical protein